MVCFDMIFEDLSVLIGILLMLYSYWILHAV